MSEWKIKAYITEGGRNIAKEWCDSVDDIAWLAFAVLMDHLCGQPRKNWVFPDIRALRGGKKGKKTGCAGLYELRFDAGKVEYRPLGYFPDGTESEFVVLYFAEERGNDFVPPNTCEIAKKRKAIVEANKERAREFVIQENIKQEDSGEQEVS